MADNGKVFELEFPVEHKSTIYNKFTARRPRVSDIRDFMKLVDVDPIQAMQKMISNLCEVDEPIVAKLDIDDFKVIREWIEDFFADKKDA